MLLLAGAYVGGQSGLLFAFVMAILMNVGSYWFSDKIVLRMYRASEVGPGHRLYDITARLAPRAGRPFPRRAMVAAAAAQCPPPCPPPTGLMLLRHEPGPCFPSPVAAARDTFARRWPALEQAGILFAHRVGAVACRTTASSSSKRSSSRCICRPERRGSSQPGT